MGRAGSKRGRVQAPPVLPLLRRGGWVAGCLVAGLLLHERAAAQGHPVLDPGLRITQYVHDAWQVEDGLPQNSVYAVTQTRDGYLWLGTQEGLVRFDGVRFTVFDRAGVEALQRNDVTTLLEDRDGALWIGTDGGGLTRRAGGRFTTYGAAHGLSSGFVRALYQDRAGTLWVGTIGGGLNRFDGSTFTAYTTAQGLSGDVVLAVHEDPAGDLWVGTEAGLSRISGGVAAAYTQHERLSGVAVMALLVDRAGTLWVGTENGLVARRNGRHIVYSRQDGLCGDVVRTLYEDADGSLWIGTLDGGLCRLVDGRFEAFTTRDGLTNDRVRALFQDREGSLWIGTDGGGLNRLRAGKFTPFSTAEGLSNDVVFAVLEDRHGAVWVGTEGGGLNRLDARGVTHLTTADGLPSDDVYALHEDRQGRLWVGMYGGGLCRLAGTRLACFGTADGLTSDNVFAIHDDRRGTVWVGTENGLNRIRDGRVAPFRGDGDLARSLITALHEDRHGDLWVGTYGAGLNRIRGDSVSTFTAEDGLTSDIVLSLYEDAGGTLWAGTQGGGLCRLRDERFACVTARQGLHNDKVLQILEDDQGYLWLGSNKGLSRVRKADLEACADGLRDTLATTVYSRADGLKSSEANGGTQPAAWRTRDGRLWFSTMRGVAVVDPAHLPTNPVRPPVVVEQAVFDGKPVSLGTHAVLPPGSRNLDFHYTALSFRAPGRVRFQYRLEGYDEAWVDAGTRREAYYTSLPPGTYRFLVKAANDDGLWNEEAAVVSFELQPFFYQTVWFLLLCGLGLAFGAHGAYRLRLRQVKARARVLERTVDERTRDLRLEKERTEQAKTVIEAQAERLRELDRFKTRFFANISHEFRTPLTMIVGPLENALSGGYGPLPERLEQQVQIMLRNALRLLRLINQLLDLSKLEAGKMLLQAGTRNIAAFLEGIVLSCSAFAERKGLDLRFVTDRDDVEVYFEPDKLEKVFFNLISNALKFTPAGGSITVTLAVHPPLPDLGMHEGAVEVRVRDTGKGIPAAALPYIFDRFHQVDASNTREHEGTGIGLSLVRELVLLHRGTVDVESEPGVGTTFTILLPRGKAHLKQEELVQHAGEDAFAPTLGALSEFASQAFDFVHADEAPLPAKEHAAPPEAAPLILVVDDNKDVREYLCSILDGEFRVATAANGEEGLQQAEALMPDLIISDVMMPRMDGNEFCRRVKATPRIDHIPVILLTARATHELKLEGLEVGADDYLSKPFNARELLVRVRNLLHLRHQDRELKLLNEALEERVQAQLRTILEERRRYEADLLAAKERAEASDRLKTNILDNMSHEIRTPLTAIMGYAEILSAEAPDGLQEFVAEIRQNSGRLMTTLDALLKLSWLEANRVGSRLEVCDLAPLARRVASGFESRAAGTGLALRVEAPERDAVMAWADAPALEHVLQSLLDNALKFTRRGSVGVQVGMREHRPFVAVTDTGIGISAHFLPSLFAAFTQESAGLTREYDGVGLGLTIANRLVELMGGTLEVESERGRGSTFTVLLDAVAAAPAGDGQRTPAGLPPVVLASARGASTPRPADGPA